jgi:hypothetical protein
MGDIADEHYAALFDERDERSGDEGYGPFYGRSQPQCRRCRSNEVYWQAGYKPDGTPGWRLFNEANHRPHLCASGAAPTEDAFGVVPE